jgi:hypothetical protein
MTTSMARGLHAGKPENFRSGVKLWPNTQLGYARDHYKVRTVHSDDAKPDESSTTHDTTTYVRI